MNTNKKKDERRCISVKVSPETYRRLVERASRQSQRFLRIVHLGEEAGRLLDRSLDDAAVVPTVDEVVTEL